MNALQHFGAVSGLLFNPLKSKLFVAGISPLELAVLKTITQFEEGAFPIKYLGIPLTHCRLKVEHFCSYD